MSIEKQNWTVIIKDPNFYQKQQNIISEDEFRYLIAVLRLKEGDYFTATNCTGTKASCQITGVSKKEIRTTLEKTEICPLPTPRIHLALGCPKPSTLETLVSTASEMGVNAIHIFPVDKTPFKSQIKTAKLQKISDESVRVSQSSYSSIIRDHPNMVSFLDFVSKQLKNQSALILCDEDSNFSTLSPLFRLNEVKFKQNPRPTDIFILVGPEGSFSLPERKILQEIPGLLRMSLGRNILKVETAAALACGFFCSTSY